MLLIKSLIALAFTTTVYGATVKFYYSKESTCTGRGSDVLERGNVQCDTCVSSSDGIDGPWGVEITGIGGNQLITVHDQDYCVSTSQIGQWYGPMYSHSGTTPIRSVWVSCDNQRTAIVQDIAHRRISTGVNLE